MRLPGNGIGGNRDGLIRISEVGTVIFVLTERRETGEFQRLHGVAIVFRKFYSVGTTYY